MKNTDTKIEDNSKALIRELRKQSASDIIDELEKAIKFFSHAIDEHMNKKTLPDNKGEKYSSSWVHFLGKEAICLKHKEGYPPRSKYIGKDKEHLFELINQIRHAWVIIQVLKNEEFSNKEIKVCHPTQTSQTNNSNKDESDTGIEADITGEGFAVEAYGGMDLTINKKLNKSLKNLLETKQSKLYLAYFEGCEEPARLKEIKQNQSNSTYKIEPVTTLNSQENNGIPGVKIVELSITRVRKTPQNPSKA